MIVVLDETASTNADLYELALRGAPHGSALRAVRQTGGKGRLGRRWEGEEGNLFLSVLLRPNLPLREMPRLTLGAAVAARDACGDPVRIKWPNDLVHDGRKVGGILAQADANFVVFGFGINIVATPDVDVPATCLAELGIDLTAAQLAERIVTTLLQPMSATATLDRWRAHADTLGKRVRVGDVEGEAVDIDGDGALLVRTDAGVQRILAGDVHMVVQPPQWASR